MPAVGRIVLADNLSVLAGIADDSLDLIYVDPPFNTGRRQTLERVRTVRDEADGDRVGFQGRRYRTVRLGSSSYLDVFDDYLEFLEPRLAEFRRVLAHTGTLYVHLDAREVHYCKVLLDAIFGRACFLNEVIWAYDYGGRTRRRWPPKHDTILVYVKDRRRYYFDADGAERIPYMAPGLVGPEKAALGKRVTDCYSADTQILTQRGWLPFPELKECDEVATVSASGELSYRCPSAIQRYRYTGPMCHFTAKSVDLLVTPNHRMWLRKKHESEYAFHLAHNVIQASWDSNYFALKNQLRWDGSERLRFEVPSVVYERAYCAKPLPAFDMGDWCEFMGWYLSEGCTVRYRDRYEVQIARQKPINLPRIQTLLKSMGLSFHYDKQTFVICNRQLTEYLASFGKACDKYIPRELLELSPIYLARLYGSLMAGDGHERLRAGRRPYHLYKTTSERLAGDVQELLLKLGYTASVARVSVRGRERWRPIWAVTRRTSVETTIFPTRHGAIVPYDGLVYCCTVEPHHTLVVRRNGRPAVCGNCWWHTIVPPGGKERTGYPTQKPLGILRRIVQTSSPPGGMVADFFAGSGTTGVAAYQAGRSFLLVDDSPEAARVMARRFASMDGVAFEGFAPEGP